MRRGLLASFTLAILMIPGISSADFGRWLDSRTHAGIVYFLGAAPNEIRRYDLASRTFLAPIALSNTPTAFHVDADGIYLAYDRALYRRTLAGQGETHLANTAATVWDMVTMGVHLYASQQLYSSEAKILRFNKLTGQFFADGGYQFYSLTGLSASPSRSRLFGLTLGISPSDIVAQNLAADGALLTQTDSPYHGAYPHGSKTYLFPDESRVVDDAGIIYNTLDLTYSNSLAGRVDSIAFAGATTFVLRAPDIIGYSPLLLESGRASTSHEVHSIAAAGTDIIGFYDDAFGGISTEIVPIASITPPSPADPLDPTGLSYTPDAVILSTDNVINLLSRAHRAVFRWSIADQAYVETIPLVNAPTHMAYSASGHRLYFAYADGRITKIDLATSSDETPFATLPQQARGLAVADPYVFAVDPSGAWATHYTFRSDGELISNLEWNYVSSEYIWNAATRRMYFFRDDTSPNDVHWERIDASGAIVEEGESPYHGDYAMLHPLRVSPDGSAVLIGSGVIFNGTNLQYANALSNNIEEAAWSGSLLLTVSGSWTSPDHFAQIWSPTYAPLKQLPVLGSAFHIISTGANPYLVYVNGGVPQFVEWRLAGDDADGDGIADSADAAPLDPRQFDTDGDGLTDGIDTDDDNDGVADDMDAFPLDASETLDTDADGIGDNADTDDDGDGYSDGIDAFPLDPSEHADHDGDGVGDNHDGDDDNDGHEDSQDAFPTDPAEHADTDRDGVGDNADADDDGDGVNDGQDAFPLNASESRDTDADGVGDNADLDDDGDNVADANDAFPLNPDESLDTDLDGIGNNQDLDDDGDGVADTADALPLNGNESVDTDRDGVGDNADTDDDGDGVSDTVDAFPLDAAESADTDRDGAGDNQDSDDDGDGVADSSDAFPLNASESVDTDRDGQGDNADTDDDGDTMPDGYETEHSFDPLNAADAAQDADGDGRSNVAEFRAGTNPRNSSDPPANSGGGSGGGGGSSSWVWLMALGAVAIRRKRMQPRSESSAP